MTITADKQQKLVIKISIEPEYGPMDFQNDDGTPDKELHQELKQRLRDGDMWAWCAVTVTVYLPGLKEVYGSDTLGGCSYENEEDFIKNSSYYDDMVATATEELQRKLKRALDSITDYLGN